MMMMIKWIRRIRNSLGFGVQSPSDFYFVQYVLREKTPYYGYEVLHRLIQNTHPKRYPYTEATLQLFFRIANYIEATVTVEVGAQDMLPACAMTLGHPSGRCITIGETERQTDYKESFPQISVKKGDEMVLFDETVEEIKTIELLHVAQTPHYAEIVERAIPYVNNKSLFIIDGLRDTPEKYAWWEQLQKERHRGVSYDLGTMGLLFFDSARYKEAYWVNLKKETAI